MIDATDGRNHRGNGHTVFGSGSCGEKDGGDSEDGDSANKEIRRRCRLVSREITRALRVMVTIIAMM